MASNFDYKWDGKTQTKITFQNATESKITIKLTGTAGDVKPYDTTSKSGTWVAAVPDADVKGKQFVVGAYGGSEQLIESDEVFFHAVGKVQMKLQRQTGNELAVDEPAGSEKDDKPSRSYRFKATPGNTLLEFKLDTGKSLSEYSVAEARQILVDSMSQCLGLNADLGNDPSATREAYCDLLNLWDDIPHDRWAPKDHSSSASSCGLFIRSMWRLLGVRHSMLGDPCYQNIPVAYPIKMKATQKLNALKTSKDVNELPKTGDVIYIYKGDVKSPNHIFTLSADSTIEGDKIVMQSIDGGQSRSAGDAPSLGIWPRKRHLDRNTLIFDEDPVGNKRIVNTWVSFEALLPQFKAKMIRLTRKDTITEAMKSPTTSGAA